MESSYLIFVREQYTFTVSNKELSRILTLNVAKRNPIEVNIAAIAIKKIDQDLNLVKIVVGPSDPTDEEGIKKQNKQFRQILREENVESTRTLILEVANPAIQAGTPGIFRAFYTALFCANIPVLAFYENGVPTLNVNAAFIEVPPSLLKEAVFTLKQINASNPDPQLCINSCFF